MIRNEVRNSKMSARKKRKLNKKDKLFCQYIVEGRKGADAYIDSGMATKNEKKDRMECGRKAYRYKNKPLYKEYIKELEEIVDEDVKLNIREIVNQLSIIAKEGIITEKPMKDENGEIIITKYKDAKFNMEAYKILVSHYDNMNDKGEEKVTVVFENNSEDDLED